MLASPTLSVSDSIESGRRVGGVSPHSQEAEEISMTRQPRSDNFGWAAFLLAIAIPCLTMVTIAEILSSASVEKVRIQARGEHSTPPGAEQKGVGD